MKRFSASQTESRAKIRVARTFDASALLAGAFAAAVIAALIAFVLRAGSASGQDEGAPDVPPPPPADVEAPPPPPPPPPPPVEPNLPPPEDDLPPPDAGVEPVQDFPEPSSGDRSGASSGGGTARVTVPERRGAAAIPPGQELVNIDFPEPTEIKDIIKAVALWTGKNVILDRNVNGKVQIISPRKVTKEEAYQAFLSALNLLGMTTVETGKVIKIMPVRTAVRGNLRTFLGSKWTPLTDEIVTQIVPLKYIDAKDIQATLSRIVSSNSMIAYEKTNTLIISDSGFKIRRILDILELLDVQTQQPQVAIVPIRFSDAKSVTDKVNEILKNTGGRRGSGPAYRIMNDERSNSVIVFGPPRTIQDVKALVRKFDIQLDDPSRQSSIHIRPLDYADAKKLASTLSSLAQGNKGGSGGLRRPPVRINNQPGGGGSEAAAVAELDDNVKITADEQSNSLLITGSRSAYQAINSIIRKLDIRRSQVFVEADILDINADNRFRFGTSIFGGMRGDKNSSIITTWEAGPLAPLVASQAATGTGASGTVTGAEKIAGVFAQDMTIGVLAGDKVNIPGLGEFSPGALIKLIKADANTRVLSSPHILTANNEEAKITVGEKIFYRSSEVNPQSGVPVPKVEKEDVDLTLNLKPNISNSNYVTMKIDIESSTPQIDPQTGLPKVNKRKTSQILTVKNKQTVVVSGLVQSTEFERFQKIPLLGDIPIIGWLFRNSEKGTVRNNLVIFLTPHIIHGADDLAAVYQHRVKERDEFMEQIYGSRFRNDRFYAMLPTQDDGVYRPDARDVEEKERREKMLREMNEDMMPEMGSQSTSPVEGSRELTEPVTVPMTAGGGDSGGGGGSVEGGPPPPPPPPPPSDGGDMGGDMPMVEEPPPPPPPDDM